MCKKLELLETKLKAQRSLSDIRDMRAEIKKTVIEINKLKS